MRQYTHKSHNVSVLLYHLVFAAKYRRAVFDKTIEQALKEVYRNRSSLSNQFLEIGTDKDPIHFLIQSVPTYSVTKIVTTIKSITAREIFKRYPQVKKQLWGGELWSDGYFAATVSKHGDENMISKYVKTQGNEYQKLYEDLQLSLF